MLHNLILEVFEEIRQNHESLKALLIHFSAGERESIVKYVGGEIFLEVIQLLEDSVGLSSDYSIYINLVSYLIF